MNPQLRNRKGSGLPVESDRAQASKAIAAPRRRSSLPVIVVLSVLLVLAALFSMQIGRNDIPVGRTLVALWDLLTDPDTANPDAAVIRNVRAPRTLMAILVGAALAAAGAAYQGLFRNPMVSPDLLGVSSGASVGACLGILWSLPSLGIQLLAFLVGIAAVGLVLAISSAVTRVTGGSLLILILAGTVIASLCAAITALVKYLAPTDTKLPEITFWLMGSLARTGSWRNVLILAVCFVIGILPLMVLRWKVNVLSFGDDEARTVGVNTTRVRLVVILAATLLTASAVAVCGVVGWIGLVIPHLCRFLVGPNYLKLLPCSVLAGGLFLLLVDDVARSLTSGEIPLGILTSIIGAPAFIHLLFRGQRSWST